MEINSVKDLKLRRQNKRCTIEIIDEILYYSISNTCHQWISHLKDELAEGDRAFVAQAQKLRDLEHKTAALLYQHEHHIELLVS